MMGWGGISASEIWWRWQQPPSILWLWGIFQGGHRVVNCNGGRPQTYSAHRGCHWIYVGDAHCGILLQSCGGHCGHGSPHQRPGEAVSSGGRSTVMWGVSSPCKDLAISANLGAVASTFAPQGCPEVFSPCCVKIFGAPVCWLEIVWVEVVHCWGDDEGLGASQEGGGWKGTLRMGSPTPAGASVPHDFLSFLFFHLRASGRGYHHSRWWRILSKNFLIHECGQWLHTPS